MSKNTPNSDPLTPLALRRLQAEIHMNSARVLRGMERRVQILFEEEGIMNLTPAQANVLMLLFHRRKAARASGWIKRERDPEDARAWLVSPTPQAYNTLGALINVSNRMMDQAFQDFEPDEIEAFHAQTLRVVANLSDEKHEPNQ